MAPRAPSTLLSQTTSAPVTATLFQPTSARASPRPVSATPRLDALADVGSALLPTKIKPGMPPQYQPMPLTGAAAMEDLRRQREMEQARQQQYMTSPNPAAHTRATLLGQPMHHMMSPSTLSHHPPMSDKSPIPPRILGSNVPPPQTSSTRMDPPQITSSPLAMSSPLRPPISTTPSTTTPIPENPRKRPASPKVERSNKAKSYPPPPPNIGSGDHRNMSFPAPDTPGRISKSPSTTTTKKHKCPHCETEFTRHHNLKSHLLTHSQEKPYACVECPSKFRRLHDLKRHQKLHSGERPHVCDKCGRKFARGDALARHNKGPGGCAGVRGQGEGEDEDDDGQDDTTMMDAEDRDEDDVTVSGSRRQSEPHRDSIVSSPSAYRQYSSTYPPPISRMSSTATPSQMRPIYPPQTTSSSVSNSREQSYARSPTEMTHNQTFAYSYGPSYPSAPGALSSLPPATSSAAFGASSGGVMMTESPQPLSRDQADEIHRSGGTSYSSLSAKMHETQLQPRHPPPGPQANILPSLASFPEARYAGPMGSHPPPMQPPAIMTSHPSLSGPGQQNPGYGIAERPSTAASGPASAISSTASGSAPHSLNSAGDQTQPSSASSLRQMYPSALGAVPSQPQPQSHAQAQPQSYPQSHSAGHTAHSSAGSIRELGLPGSGSIGSGNLGGGGGGGGGDSLAVEYIRNIERREQSAQAEMRMLKNEIDVLRAQVARQQVQIGQYEAQIERMRMGMGAQMG